MFLTHMCHHDSDFEKLKKSGKEEKKAEKEKKKTRWKMIGHVLRQDHTNDLNDLGPRKSKKKRTTDHLEPYSRGRTTEGGGLEIIDRYTKCAEKTASAL